VLSGLIPTSAASLEEIPLVVREFLAVLFLYAAVRKLYSSGWKTGRETVDLIVAAGFGNTRATLLLTTLLPVFEIVLGVWLLIGWGALGASVAAVILLAIFLFFVVRAFKRGYRKGCGCFGDASKSELGIADIAFNSALVLLGSIAVLTERLAVAKNLTVLDSNVPVVLCVVFLLAFVGGLRALSVEMQRLVR
jgi:uncharacterized membrane protein YphA (DoxX/SURF4 family)